MAGAVIIADSDDPDGAGVGLAAGAPFTGHTGWVCERRGLRCPPHARTQRRIRPASADQRCIRRVATKHYRPPPPSLPANEYIVGGTARRDAGKLESDVAVCERLALL